MQNRPLNIIYLTNSIYSLAGSFVGIFIPIYLLNLNVTVAHVVWFYFISAIGMLVFFLLANRITHSIGLRKTALLGYPVLFLYFFLLYTINRYGTPLYVIAFVNALQTTLYWFPLHIWLTNVSTTENMGSELGKFFTFSRTIGIFAPFIAGFIAVYLGFKTLFVFASIIYVISAFPLLFLPEFQYDTTFRANNILNLFKRYHTYALADILENVREDAESIIWPIFVYLSFKNILSIGYIGTIGGISGALFTLLVGKYVDRIGKKKLMQIGAVIVTVIWIIRFFARSQISFYILTLCVGFFEALILIPLSAVVYGAAKREGAATFILFREFLVTVGRVILYGLTLLMLSHVANIFIVAALAGAGLLYLSGKNLETQQRSAEPAVPK